MYFQKIRNNTAKAAVPAPTGWFVGLCMVSMLYATGCRRDPIVEPTVGMQDPQSRWVRVLLFDKLRECTVSADGGLVVTDLSSRVTADFESGHRPLEVLVQDGRIRIGSHLLGTRVHLQTGHPYLFSINNRPYRGNLQLSVNSRSDGLIAVNELPMEEYLCGVLAAEMQSYWEPQALMAQAVACRTYALFIKHRFGSNRLWDLRANQAHQMYLGVLAETPTTRQAVFDTEGLVLVCSVEGNESIFPTYYSSSCGGHTADSSRVFGDDYPPLSGVECPWCKEVTHADVFSWKPVSFSTETIQQRLMERYPSLRRLERIERIEAAQTNEYGRITSVRLRGVDERTAYLRGEDFRLALDPGGRKIRSTLFVLNPLDGRYEITGGKGFGHGVGLCQSGAQGMARNGNSFQQILNFYYPESRLVRIQAQHDEAI